ncbi:uncharacterized protein LOC106673715 isoform X2 [Cimex lectularius]|uniref:Uncharacterized protein n=1 Tax=Cimex lectularius TaxID=79782 RepID=A0A8I6SH11_CIMLE|nr:uncharacterized protein LOC106673715 isoform X2 [Cimex lectularius]
MVIRRLILIISLFSTVMPYPQDTDDNMKRQLERAGSGKENDNGVLSMLGPLGNMQSALGPFTNNIKGGQMVIGGFSFLIFPSPKLDQLQNLQSQIPTQLPFLPG